MVLTVYSNTIPNGREEGLRLDEAATLSYRKPHGISIFHSNGRGLEGASAKQSQGHEAVLGLE